MEDNINLEDNIKLEPNKILAPFTTLKIGGPADLFVEVHSRAELIAALRLAQTKKWRHFVLGNGSNVLFPDDGFRGLVIRNRSAGYQVEGQVIYVESGMFLAQLLNIAAEHALEGPEKWVGIPGTVGGAVRGNAGIPEYEIKDSLVKATIFTASGQVREVKPDYLEFAYRESRVKHNSDIILDATFDLTAGQKDEIEKSKQDILKNRIGKQPRGKSAGSFFKNPKQHTDKSAGYLIEQAGLKGYRIGDAMVSEQHGNFLLNADQATCEEFMTLVRKIQDSVKQKFGIELEPEVMIVTN